MLPYVVANRGLIPATLSEAIAQFVAMPQRLLTIEREFSTGDPVLCRATFRIVVQRAGLGSGAPHPTSISADVICAGGGSI